MKGTLEDLAERAFRPAAQAVEERRVPAAVLGLVTADGTTAIRRAGLRQWEPETLPLETDTWFDLASLTKVILTVPAILRLAEVGHLDLDDPLGRYLPEIASPGVAALTLRQCLAHTSGLPWHERLWEWPEAADPTRVDVAALKARVLAEPWAIGAPVYSDINLILAGLVVERLTRAPLGHAITGEGLAAAPPPGVTVATTEICGWRGHWLVGEVHDENAAALGGVAGHAGLFGSVEGVLGYARRILDRTLLSPDALDAMMAPQAPTRALGWERRYDRWTGGMACSAATIGHTGFTGTGLWIDPPAGIGWTLLTNRVHPTRERETGIMELRRAVSTEVSTGARSLGIAA